MLRERALAARQEQALEMASGTKDSEWMTLTKLEAARARLKAEREQRLAERIEAGEIVRCRLSIVAGTESEARAQVEAGQSRQAGGATRRR